MKKILTIIVVGISILFITACNSNNENNVAIDVDDNTTTVIDTVVEMKDTTIKTIEDWIVYETIDFSLPLYKFADTKIHDTLLSIVNNQFGNDFDAVSIVYFPTVDTIGTYGKDSVPYLYNLYIGTINYYYYGVTWKSMLESIIGCSMIGDNLCYIEGVSAGVPRNPQITTILKGMSDYEPAERRMHHRSVRRPQRRHQRFRLRRDQDRAGE